MSAETLRYQLGGVLSGLKLGGGGTGGGKAQGSSGPRGGAKGGSSGQADRRKRRRGLQKSAETVRRERAKRGRDARDDDGDGSDTGAAAGAGAGAGASGARGALGTSSSSNSSAKGGESKAQRRKVEDQLGHRRRVAPKRRDVVWDIKDKSLLGESRAPPSSARHQHTVPRALQRVFTWEPWLASAHRHIARHMCMCECRCCMALTRSTARSSLHPWRARTCGDVRRLWSHLDRRPAARAARQGPHGDQRQVHVHRLIV